MNENEKTNWIKKLTGKFTSTGISDYQETEEKTENNQPPVPHPSVERTKIYGIVKEISPAESEISQAESEESTNEPADTENFNGQESETNTYSEQPSISDDAIGKTIEPDTGADPEANYVSEEGEAEINQAPEFKDETDEAEESNAEEPNAEEPEAEESNAEESNAEEPEAEEPEAEEQVQVEPEGGEVDVIDKWIAENPDLREREARYLRSFSPELPMTVSEEGNLQKAFVVNGGFIFMIELDKNFPMNNGRRSPVTVYLVKPNKQEYMQTFRLNSLDDVAIDARGLEYLVLDTRRGAYSRDNCELIVEETINETQNWVTEILRRAERRRSAYNNYDYDGDYNRDRAFYGRNRDSYRSKYSDARTEVGARPHPQCKKVVLSNRAFAQILSETYHRIRTETGGLLLGHFEKGVWYVVEATDPGINATFTASYHEGDDAYENHLSAALSRLYKYPLVFLGMWHRHPGSLDSFSGTDDRTNYKYAGSAGNGCISALINVDPDFRITFYYVERDEANHNVYYTKVDVEVGDELFDNPEVLQYTSPREQINRLRRRDY